MLDWALVSVFNIAGQDGREDFDLIAGENAIDEHHGDRVDWNIIVMEEHTHEFHNGDKFDANDLSYRVCPLIIVVPGSI